MGINVEIIKKRKPNLIWESGDKYGYWMLTGKSYLDDRNRRFVECICVCGKIKFIRLKEVANNHSKSCGCKKAEIQQRNMVKHGMTINGVSHPIYTAWISMKKRCYNETCEEYINYGARGIDICDEWLKDFNSFYKWAIENNWQKGLSLERVDNFKGYSPDNCIWATDAIQNRNKRTNNIITAFGETKCLQDWANDGRCKISYDSIWYRIKKLGWTAEKAITYPKMKRNGQLA